MGEPGYNWKNVKKAMSIAMDPTGLAISIIFFISNIYTVQVKIK